VDYDAKSELTQTFYKTVQNKLEWAITGKTAAEIIQARVSSEKPNMGLTSWKNAPSGKVLKSDVSLVKNYLEEPELKELNRIVSMYLDYAENQAARFKNIVFEYSLAQALHDGKYIKIPSIATRANFDAKGKTPDEMERIKLEDAISVHENTKVELERYALETGRPKVKPFILVVCSDTTHAKHVFGYTQSEAFYQGLPLGILF
jgi:hypothetical protein